MTNNERADEADAIRLRWDGREDLLAMCGSKNLTRDGPIISHRSRNHPQKIPSSRRSSTNELGGMSATWQAPRPKVQRKKDCYLSFFGGLSSFGLGAGFAAAFFSACCFCLRLASSASCFFSSASSCCWCC